MPDILQTIAEIGIAIAGFSGLIVAFRRRSGPLTAIERYRLMVLLLLALGAMFLSLLPGLLGLLGIPGDRLWRVACGATALYSTGFVGWWLTVSRRIRALAPEIFSVFAFGRMLIGHLAVLGLQLHVVIASAPRMAQGVFVFGLAWYLLHATQQFVRMLFVRPRDDD